MSNIKVQCPKQNHDKKLIQQICLHPKCKEDSLICIKCKPQHEHQNYLFTFQQLQEFLTKNVSISVAINNPLTIEIINTFSKYKSLIIEKLNGLETKLKEAITQFNEIESIKSIAKNINQNIVQYGNLEKIIQDIQQACYFDQNLQKIQSIELTQKQNRSKSIIISAINQLQKVVVALQEGFHINKIQSTVKQNFKNQQIKRYEIISSDSDGSLSVKQLNNKIIVCAFQSLQTCDLQSFYQPQFYKGKGMDFQNQNITCNYKIHLGLDLTIWAYEWKYEIQHNQIEKPNSYCYLIKLPEQFRLLQGQTYLISMQIEGNKAYSYSYQKSSDQNGIIQFLFPKSYKSTIQIDDFGFYPCLCIV